MPTALERQGNFSQSVNTNGTPIIIRNPVTGQPFAGNIIPASQQNPIGVAMLNQFPLPNTTDPTGQRQFNFLFTPVFRIRARIRFCELTTTFRRKTLCSFACCRIIRINPATERFWVRRRRNGDSFRTAITSRLPGVAATYIHTFTPSVVNELTWGINKAHQGNSPTNQAIYNQSLLPLKDANGNALATPNIFPAAVNTMKLKPNVNFGLPSGFSAQSAPTPIPNLPAYGFDSRWPFDGTDSLQNLTENITFIRGPHTFKAGFYYEHDARNVSVYSTFNTAGTYYFGSDLGNPVDSGDPLSNAILGSLYGYGQDNQKLINRARYKQFEWFIQDTWKVFRRLTVDYGMRFQIMGPLYSSEERWASSSNLLTTRTRLASSSIRLAWPTVQAVPVVQRVPSIRETGQTFPYVDQGTFDPATYASGSVPFSGIAQYHSNFFQLPFRGLQSANRIRL